MLKKREKETCWTARLIMLHLHTNGLAIWVRIAQRCDFRVDMNEFMTTKAFHRSIYTQKLTTLDKNTPTRARAAARESFEQTQPARSTSYCHRIPHFSGSHHLMTRPSAAATRSSTNRMARSSLSSSLPRNTSIHNRKPSSTTEPQPQTTSSSSHVGTQQ